jgi:hypothetical protein
MKTSLDTIKSFIIKTFSDKYDILDLGWVFTVMISIFMLCLCLFVPFSELFIKAHFSEFYLTSQQAFNQSLEAGILNPSWFLQDNGSPLFSFIGTLNYYLTYIISHFFNISLLTSSKLILVGIFFLGFLGAYLFFRTYFTKIAALCGALIFAFFPTQLAHIFFVFSPQEILGGMTLIVWLLWAIIKFDLTTNFKLLKIWGFLIILFTGLIGLAAPISLLIWTPFILLFIGTETREFSWKILNYFLLGFLLASPLIWNAIHHDILTYSNLNLPEFSQISFNIFSLKYWAIDPIINQSFTTIQPLSMGIISILIGGFLLVIKNIFEKNKKASTLNKIKSKLHLNLLESKNSQDFDNLSNKNLQQKYFKLSIFLLISFISILIFIYIFKDLKILSNYSLPISWKILSVLALITGFLAALLAQSWSHNIYFSRILVIGIFITILWTANLPYMEGTHLSNWEKYPAIERTEKFNKSYFIPNPKIFEIEEFKNKSLILGKLPLEIHKKTIISPEELHFTIGNKTAQNILFLQNYFTGWIVEINKKKTLYKKSEDNFIQVYLPPGEHNLMFKIK